MATLGCDLASVDDNGDPDWKTAMSLGHLRFVGLRAAEGVTPDPVYRSYRQQLEPLGVPSFPYLLLTPGLTTPEEQVSRALVAIGVLDRTCFPLALDVEGDRRGLSAGQWRDWIVRACASVRAALGVPPMIYTSRVYWADPAGMSGLPAPELADCLGWWKYWPIGVDEAAMYDPVVVDRLTAPPAPVPWGGQWGIHQYQGDARGYPGFRSTVDLNRLHVVGLGDQGDTVAWIQRHLNFGIAADGIFGPKTVGAVKIFQSSNQIQVDGIVGLDTMQRLAWSPVSSRTVP
jgi:hypothetical protein